jgi:hypothetical protein
LKKTVTKKRASGVAQGVDPEFKPRYHKKKKRKKRKTLIIFLSILKTYHKEIL